VKVSNEKKIGLLGILAITLFVLGFNFLKGRNLFSHKTTLYAKYSNIQGLTPSNPVMINGMQVGSVKEITNDKDMKELIVVFTIEKEINIPKNSFASINANPLSVTKVEINLGNTNSYLKNNDTIMTKAAGGFLDNVFEKVDPVVNSVNNALGSLDSLMANVSAVIEINNRKNISEIMLNLNKITASVLKSSTALEVLLNDQNGPLASTLKHTSDFTENLASNNKRIDSLLKNLNKTSTQLSNLNLQKTLTTLDSTINGLKQTVSKINEGDGSIGKLLNDGTLYKNLTATSNKINILLDDVRLHPKRYVSISVFGKKEKEKPLEQPLPDGVSPIEKK
jgi:phospholipid/cholesterol/gamma-HCH transport system substrate-binding protein